MDSDLYDEFGNYIGPDLESDDDDDQSIYGQEPQEDQDVSSELQRQYVFFLKQMVKIDWSFCRKT